MLLCVADNRRLPYKFLTQEWSDADSKNFAREVALSAAVSDTRRERINIQDHDVSYSLDRISVWHVIVKFITNVPDNVHAWNCLKGAVCIVYISGRTFLFGGHLTVQLRCDQVYRHRYDCSYVKKRNPRLQSGVGWVHGGVLSLDYSFGALYPENFSKFSVEICAF